MKRCKSAKKCKTSADGPISLSEFEVNDSGNPKSRCRRCYNTAISSIDIHSSTQLLMATIAWVPGNQVKINDHVSQLRMAL